MALTVDVVVPIHGGWAHTARCLASLAEQTLPHRVIVVDDASPDDSLDRLGSEWPGVDVVALPLNRGFAAACNAGIRTGDGDVVILVNNDVIAEPGMLAGLVEPFREPRVASSAPLLFAPDGRIDAFGITADPTLAGFVRLHGAEAGAERHPEFRLLGPYGAVAAFRRRALDEVGLLDEGIFMYGEELDLALRLSAAGWRAVATATARGTHLGGATAGRGSARQRWRSGFGRGYVLRAWRVMRGRYAARALVTELGVCVVDALGARDLAALRGRIAGWRAGARAAPRPRVVPDLDSGIGFLRSLRLRRQVDPKSVRRGADATARPRG